eukprot:GILJ01009433.1.p1 GENE.GILJ01009433.1~~GILJ01009433.1.p1  ORF type:complete len:623 (+),score=133.41 GILJ01009433.1:42-1910(+)
MLQEGPSMSLSSAWTPLEKAAHHWRTLALDEKREELDDQAEVIADEQMISLNARKRLAEATKEFKRSPVSTQAELLGALLKTYQEEIDRLSKRSKFAEQAFLSVYKQLREAPDPVVYLEQAVQSQQALLIVQHLKEENAELKKELRQSKSEPSVSTAVTDQMIQEALDTERMQWIQKIEEQRIEAEQRWSIYEKEYKRRVEDSENACRAAQREAEMVAEEFDRVQQTLLEKDQILLQHAQEITTLAAQIKTQTELKETFERLQTDHESVLDREQELRHQVHDLNQLIAKLQDEKSTLVYQLQAAEIELTGRLSAESTNQYISALKHIFHTLQQRLGETAEIEVSMSELTNVSWLDNWLDGWLSQCQTRMEADTITLKSTIKDLEIRVQATEAAKESLQERLQDQQKLIIQLESQIGSPNAGTAATVATSPVTQEEGAESFVQILLKQRDRYRHRCLELESESAKQRQEIDSMRNQVQQLQKDNTDLYGKIQYLHKYQGTTQNNNAHPNQSSVQLRVGSEQRYRNMYEETVDPWKEFRKSETEKRLNGAEKFVLETTRFFLSNKYTRLFLFIYLICLHLLVFFSTYRSMLNYSDLSHSRVTYEPASASIQSSSVGFLSNSTST